MGLVAILMLGAGFTAPLGAGSESPPGLGDEGLVLVRGGSFQMGDLFGDSPWAMPELPVHEVWLDDFLLAKHEVTVGEFERFVKATGYQTTAERVVGTEANRGFVKDGKQFHPSWRAHFYKQNADHPVVMTSWEDAMAYCNWLSREHKLPPAYDEKTKHLLGPDGQPTQDLRQVKGFRLPTEAEWEFAARERGRKVRFGNGQDIARAAEMNFDAAGTGKMVPESDSGKPTVISRTRFVLGISESHKPLVGGSNPSSGTTQKATAEVSNEKRLGEQLCCTDPMSWKVFLLRTTKRGIQKSIPQSWPLWLPRRAQPAQGARRGSAGSNLRVIRTDDFRTSQAPSSISA